MSCAPVETFGGEVTAKYDTYVYAPSGYTPAPGGWSAVTFGYTIAGVTGEGWAIRLEFYDAAFVALGNANVSVAIPATGTASSDLGVSQVVRDAIRYVRVGGYPFITEFKTATITAELLSYTGCPGMVVPLVAIVG